MTISGKHIFIVEDDLSNRMIYKVVMNQHGANVYFEGWGPDAVKHLQRLPEVDLIVLDLMLQRGASGYDVFEGIRELPRFAHVPIVAVSAAEPHDAIIQTRARGFSGFIAKPIDQGLFAHQLAQVLAGGDVWVARPF